MSENNSAEKIDKAKMNITDEVAIHISDMNKWFGTFHDGTFTSHEKLKHRRGNKEKS